MSNGGVDDDDDDDDVDHLHETRIYSCSYKYFGALVDAITKGSVI